MNSYNPDVLISEEEIALRVKALAEAITNDFENEEVVVICVLKGAFMFCSDLLKQINIPVRLDFMQLSSYGDGMQSTGSVKIELDLSESVKDKNVVIVEDIVDSGLTMKTMLELIRSRGPKSLKLASLLYKPSRKVHSVPIDYLGFEIEDKFVVGYGLDYAGRYREIPYVGVINAGN